MRHSQDIGKRERMERAAKASLRKEREREMIRKLCRLQERDSVK